MNRKTIERETARIRRMLRQRRFDSRQRRADKEEPEGWITIKGNHIPLDKFGVAMGGAGGWAKGKVFSKAKSTASTSSSKSTSSGGTKYLSASKASSAKVVGGYRRKHTFKNGYMTTEADPKARADKKSGVTMRKHTNAAGEWTEEREALHSKIIDKAFDGIKKPAGKPVTTFMGGGPASGKSYVVDKESDNLNLPKKDERVLVDPDKCKQSMPEYDPKNPSPVHEESSAVSKRITKIAQENGYNVLVDGTGDGSIDKMNKKIKEARDAGHIVNAVYVFRPIENAIIANADRDRSVDPELLVSTHKAISTILPAIAPNLDDVKLYANMKEGEPPVLIASGGGGKKLTVHNEELYKMFLRNADYVYNQQRVNYLQSKVKVKKKK